MGITHLIDEIIQLLKLAVVPGYRSVIAPSINQFDRESREFQITILGVVFGILAAISVVLSMITIPVWYKQDQFEQHSVATTAVVTKIYGFTSDYFRTIDVEFTYDADGRQIEASVPSLIRVHKPGSTLELRYLPENPQVFQIRGQEPLVTSPLPPVIFSIFFGLLVRGTLLRRKEFGEIVSDIVIVGGDSDEKPPRVPVQQEGVVPILPQDIPLNDLPLNELPMRNSIK